MILPEFKTNAGNKVTEKSLFVGGERFYVQNSTEKEARGYVRTLCECGFTLSLCEELPYENGYKGGKNLSFSLEKGDLCAFLFFDAALLTSFVNLTPKTPMPKPRDKAALPYGEVKLSQLKLIGGGMSYALSLPDGSFILVDGGLRSREDTDYLYSFLCENSPKGEDVPRIALWIFTHGHCDHIDLAAYFLRNYGGRVKIDAFAHHFANSDAISGVHDALECEGAVNALLSEIEKMETIVYTLHTGWRFFYPGVEIEILSTPDNTFIPLYYSLNDMSVVMRIKAASGKSALLLSDITGHVSRQLSHTYGAYLKSDVLQVSHHGLLGGDIGLYKLIDPDICLWPVKKARFDGNLDGQEYQ